MAAPSPARNRRGNADLYIGDAADSAALVRYVGDHDVTVLLNDMVLHLIARKPPSDVAIYAALIDHLQGLSLPYNSSVASVVEAAPLPNESPQRRPRPVKLPQPTIVSYTPYEATVKLQSAARRQLATRAVARKRKDLYK